MWKIILAAIAGIILLILFLRVTVILSSLIIIVRVVVLRRIVPRRVWRTVRILRVRRRVHAVVLHCLTPELFTSLSLHCLAASSAYPLCPEPERRVSADGEEHENEQQHDA